MMALLTGPLDVTAMDKKDLAAVSYPQEGLSTDDKADVYGAEELPVLPSTHVHHRELVGNIPAAHLATLLQDISTHEANLEIVVAKARNLMASTLPTVVEGKKRKTDDFAVFAKSLQSATVQEDAQDIATFMKEKGLVMLRYPNQKTLCDEIKTRMTSNASTRRDMLMQACKEALICEAVRDLGLVINAVLSPQLSTALETDESTQDLMEDFQDFSNRLDFYDNMMPDSKDVFDVWRRITVVLFRKAVVEMNPFNPDTAKKPLQVLRFAILGAQLARHLKHKHRHKDPDRYEEAVKAQSTMQHVASALLDSLEEVYGKDPKEDEASRTLLLQFMQDEEEMLQLAKRNHCKMIMARPLVQQCLNNLWWDQPGKLKEKMDWVSFALQNALLARTQRLTGAQTHRESQIRAGNVEEAKRRSAIILGVERKLNDLLSFIRRQLGICKGEAPDCGNKCCAVLKLIGTIPLLALGYLLLITLEVVLPVVSNVPVVYGFPVFMALLGALKLSIVVIVLVLNLILLPILSLFPDSWIREWVDAATQGRHRMFSITLNVEHLRGEGFGEKVDEGDALGVRKGNKLTIAVEWMNIYWLSTPAIKFFLASATRCVLIICLTVCPAISPDGWFLWVLIGWLYVALHSEVRELSGALEDIIGGGSAEVVPEKDKWGTMFGRAMREYHSDPLNPFELIGLVFALISILTLWTHGGVFQVNQSLLATAVMLLWLVWGLRLLMLSVRMGPLVLMLLKMLRDVTQWLILTIVVILGFAAAFFVLFQEGAAIGAGGGSAMLSEDCYSVDMGHSDLDSAQGSGRFVWIFVTLVMNVWELSKIGVGMEGPMGCLEATSEYLVSIGVFLALYMVVMVALLMNMLIAIMAKTFDDIWEMQDMHFKMLHAQMVLNWAQKETVPPPLALISILHPGIKSLARLTKKLGSRASLSSVMQRTSIGNDDVALNHQDKKTVERNFKEWKNKFPTPLEFLSVVDNYIIEHEDDAMDQHWREQVCSQLDRLEKMLKDNDIVAKGGVKRMVALSDRMSVQQRGTSACIDTGTRNESIPNGAEAEITSRI